MARRLTDLVTSSYVGSASRLGPKAAPRRVVAYVESFDDVLFWRGVLSRLEHGGVRFEVMLPSRSSGSLAKGKKPAITAMLAGGLGPNLIACVDADYDWLLQGATPLSATVCDNPYVFHTHAYAIENFQCYAPALRGVCVMATLNDRPAFDFEAFLTSFSETVWPLFVWSVWCRVHGCSGALPLSELRAVAACDVNVLHPERAVAVVRRKVGPLLSRLQRALPQARATMPRTRDSLARLGVTPQNAYMYMRGHDLFESVVSPLVGKVCAVLRGEREREIRSLAVNAEQREGELASYRHSVIPTDMALRKHALYDAAPQYRAILDDLRRFLASAAEAAEKGGGNAV